MNWIVFFISIDAVSVAALFVDPRLSVCFRIQAGALKCRPRVRVYNLRITEVGVELVL
jgi:hypothetical protein